MALGDRLKVFSDIVKLGRYFFTETLTHDPDAVKKRLRKDGVATMLGELDEVLATVEPYDLATLEKAIHDYAESHGHAMGDVVNPLRVATTGQGVGPGLYDCLVILGRESCRARIAATLAMLEPGSGRLTSGRVLALGPRPRAGFSHAIRWRRDLSLLVVGSIALDSVETPHGVVKDALGGSATYFSYAASYFTPVRLVGVVGEDFPSEHRAMLEGRNIDTSGLVVAARGRDLPLAGEVPGGHERGRDAGGPPQRPGHVRPRPLAGVRRDALRLPGQRQPRHAAQGALAGQGAQARRGRHDELLDRDPARRALRAAPRGRRPGPQRRRGADADRGGQPRPRRAEGARARAEVRHHQEGGARRDVPQRPTRRS